MTLRIAFTASALILLLGADASAVPRGPHKPSYWFSFGDSYTATYFNITTGPLPNDANPIGNPIFPGYTACGLVNNWIDDMTAVFNKTQIYTYNFAYGGATIDANYVVPYAPHVLSLTDQVNSYLSTVASRPPTTPWTTENSMFSFFIGINDNGMSWWLPEAPALRETLFDLYFALIDKVYNTGARKFLFINVPGVDRSPYVIAAGQYAQDNLKLAILDWNEKLRQRIKTWKKGKRNLEIHLYDSYSRLVEILDSPQQYGFSDAISYGSDPALAWCNDFHVSPGVQRFWAKDIAELIKDTRFA